MKIHWDEIERYADIVAKKVLDSHYKFDIIVGIATSGLVPTTLVSKALGIKNVVTISASSYEGYKKGSLKFLNLPRIEYLKGVKNVLLVDDIVATGGTMEAVRNLFKNDFDVLDVKTSSLVVSERVCEKYPDFYGKSILREEDDFIFFPWDKYEGFTE
ncbi:MAG: hypothetical protein COU06_02635 [Candidatus Harrisonbacteria bacterium CG10_big_fil_rev_8_21_14_0_10_38_8]|uniref:Phosphoribosyltransferase domain-containing protein n=1 Tax=Candidatus Harrisonbacteria bacterium CG10_big_fil_rev_8_21_14_0_10_38_8 TaxID=1974582 RepID=A0A2M6WJG5_9BACT|nr:MAG: hypothetical protein COU06_02635 [Candidatus Harrisonbacteria bacterium CG10_big_fil_rev_8_21_14_0_10_38_8]